MEGGKVSSQLCNFPGIGNTHYILSKITVLTPSSFIDGYQYFRNLVLPSSQLKLKTETVMFLKSAGIHPQNKVPYPTRL